MKEWLALIRTYRRSLSIFFLLLAFLFLALYPLWLLNRSRVKGAATINVEVSGAVKQPGLYTLKLGSRVEDALRKAQGLSSNADTQFVAEILNRARILRDGEKIFVPLKKTEPSDQSDQASKSTTSSAPSEKRTKETSTSFPVNINKASANQLEALPGIGPVYAQRIVDYRKTNGPFKNKEQIKEVKGIGESTYNKIKDKIVL